MARILGFLFVGLMTALVIQIRAATDAPESETELETDFDIGYLIVAPKVFVAETTESICVTLQNMTGPIELSIKLFDNTTLLSKLPVQFMEFRMACYDLEVPAIEEEIMEATLVIKMRRTLVTQDGFEVTEQRLITLEGVNTEMFIETDKPVYKPGQTVKFRILNLNQDLKPDIMPVTEIWIESPGGVRMQQWRDQEGTDGLIDLEMPMTSDPVLGTWTIHAIHRGREQTQSFEVDEYVLPKFEILITPPPFIMINETRITVSVCGRYTYGQPVRGSFQASITVLSEGWNFRERRMLTYNEEDTGPSGCSDVPVAVSRLELNSTDFSLWNARLSVAVDYTESSTGVTLSGRSESSKVTRDALNLQFDSPNVFKPGVPFHGKILVTYPDGSPAVNKLISMSCNSDQGKIFEKNYTTPENGAIDFSVTDINITATSLNLYAFAPGFTIPAPEKFGRHQQYTLHDPATSLYVRPQYSPSGSFLQLVPIRGTGAVGSEQLLTIDYTARSPTDNIRFRFVVMSRGNIIPTRLYRANRRGRRQAEGDEELPEDLPSVPSVDMPSVPSVLSVDMPSVPSEPSDPELPSEPSSAGEGGSAFPGGSNFPGGSTFPSGSLPGSLGSHSFSSAFSFVPPTDPPVVIVEPGELYTRQLKFRVSPNMVPETRIMAYYIRTDGEIVADSTAFTVEKKFENEVEIAFRDEERMPGAETQIMIRASPGSLCAVGVVDRSVHILGGDNQLKPDKIFRSLDRYQLSSVGGYLEPSDRCAPDEDEFPQFFPLGRKKRSVFLPGYGSKYQDSSRAFMNMGLIYISNMDVETSPCIGVASTAKGRGGAGGSNEGPIAIPLILRQESNTDQDDILEKADIPSGVLETAPRIRSYFPETWLWDLRRTDESTGETSITMEVPDTVTEWIGSGFCTSPEYGVGVSPPTKLRAFQPFFLSYTLPFSVIRGEIVPVRVTVFNYLMESLVVEVSLQMTEDFRMAKRSRNRQRVCVGGSQSQSVEFRIIPRNLGNIDLQALGLSVNDRDALCGNELVSSQLGARDIIHKQLLVEAEGAEVETTYNCYLCPEETDGVFTKFFNVTLPATMVPGSARGKISVTGDLMGPSLSNLDHLIQLPTGCGEQNMLGFVPNVVALSYLNTTDQLTRSIENKASFNMKRGYQRELNYRHGDGSYSAFGENDPEGSTWLTAFVVRSFAQASDFIYIDDKDLNVSILWLQSLQDPETGCFESKGKLCHKGMKGGVDNKRTLTSYVLLSMLEAGLSTNDSVVADALTCVTRDLDLVDDTYALAQMAYTLTLADSPLRDDVLERLEAEAIHEDGLKYWQSNRTPTQTYDYYSQQAPSLDIEITSYILLASIAKVEEVSDALLLGSPIARWIILQRNSNGGFSSTQDTVVALQALAEYAKVAYSEGTSINAMVTAAPLKGTAESKRFTFSLDNLNRLVLQEETFSLFPSQVTLSGTGSGCALMQVSTVHNEIPGVPGDAGFDVDVLVLEAYESTKNLRCTDYYMKVCARYLGSDDESNMAIILVKMVSGYYPDKTSLELLQKQHKPLQRYELDGKNIYFYFNELTSDGTCLVFTVTKEIDVTDAKDGVVQVYDYYDKDVEVKKMYNMVCDVDMPSWAASLLFTVPVETPDGQRLGGNMRPLPFVMEALRNVDGLALVDAPGPEPDLVDGELVSENEPRIEVVELGPPNVFILCPAGQKFVDGLRRCVPINGCASNPCLEGQNCIDTDADFLCVGCKPGYRKGDANLCVRLPHHSVSLIICGPGEEYVNGACTSINECISNPCPLGARCVDTQFGHSCEPVRCPPRFELTDDLRCVAISACDSNPCSEEESCTSTGDGFICASVECADGYQMNGNDECVDVNECETVVEPCGGPEYICLNDEGSYQCDCVEGYTMDDEGYCIADHHVGECPATTAELGDCGLLVECTSDDMCEEGQRCCSSDECGMRCLVAAQIQIGQDGGQGGEQRGQGGEQRGQGGEHRGEGDEGPIIDRGGIKPGLCPPEGEFGVCGGTPCEGDENCPGSQKCCERSCGWLCVLAIQIAEPIISEPLINIGERRVHPGVCPMDVGGSPICGGGPCSHDGDCGPGEKCCLSSECSPDPVCMPAPQIQPVPPVQPLPPVKPLPPVQHAGECPYVAPNDLGNCDGLECRDDGGCLATEKCCSSACGYHCTPLLQIEPLPPVKRVGECPYVAPNDLGYCEGLECRDDGDCVETAKCCGSACGYHCTPSLQMEPVEPVAALSHAGECPPLEEEGNCDGQDCAGDGDCLQSEKCCVSSCGYHCTPALQVEPPIPECKGDLVFNECGPACEETCEDTKPLLCIGMCLPGCSCPQGLLRRFSGSKECVSREECLAPPETPESTGPESCTGDLVYNSCGTACPLTCDEPDPRPCTRQCVMDCFCPVDMLRVSQDSDECVASVDLCHQDPQETFDPIPVEIVCTGDMVYKECGSECDPYCNDAGDTVCTAVCAPGCGCPEDTIKLSRESDECVPREGCPQTIPPECPDGLVFNSCGSSCEAYCGAPSLRICPAMCVRGCFCPEGLVKVDEESDVCIAAEDCPVALSCEETRLNMLEGGVVIGRFIPQCTSNGQYQAIQCHGSTGYCWCVDTATGVKVPGTDLRFARPNCEEVCAKGFVYQECGTACEPTCDDPDPQVCTEQCVAGCFCAEGMVWNGDSCVQLAECPPPTCDGDMVYQECGTACPSVCGQPEPKLCTLNCVPGCACSNGLSLDGTSCVAREDCPPTPFQCPPKIGTCPFFLEEAELECEEQCSDDFSCEGDRKCCPHLCGQICYYPDFPVPQPFSFFGPYPTSPPPEGIPVDTCPSSDFTPVGGCSGQCSSEGDCSEGELCCLNNVCDSKVCLPAVQEHRCTTTPCPVFHSNSPADLQQKVCGSDYLLIVKMRSDGRAKVLDDMNRNPNPYSTRRPIVSLVQDSQCTLTFEAEKRYIIFARGENAADMNGRKRIILDHTTLVMPMTGHLKNEIAEKIDLCPID